MYSGKPILGSERIISFDAVVVVVMKISIHSEIVPFHTVK